MLAISPAVAVFLLLAMADRLLDEAPAGEYLAATDPPGSDVWVITRVETTGRVALRGT